MDKNFFLALGLSVLLYVGYLYIVPQPQQPSPARQEQTTSSETTPQKSVNVKTADSRAVKTAAQETTYTIETKNADIVFSSKGAAIKEFVFNDVIAPVNLTPYGGEGYFATFPDVYFTRVNDASSDITFKASLTDGLDFYKSFIFDKTGGINRLSMKFVNTTSKDLDVDGFYLALGPGLATVKSEESENEANQRAVCSAQETDKKFLSVNKITEKLMNNPAKLSAQCHDWKWAAIDNRYFLAAVMPQNWKTEAGQLKYVKTFTHNRDSFWGLFGPKASFGPQIDIEIPGAVAAGSEVSFNADFYIGPKDYNFLLTLPYDLNRSIQFGFFGQFGKWARSLLEWLYGLTHNYGWAIVFMTALIQIAMFPLTYKQLKSSIVMQKIQPEMKRLQEKYKDNPQLQQKELMGLYKKYGANPFTGCLPLFIQLPIFLALFNALRTSWEIHGAPFIFWIQDLSAKDPYYVLPVAMGIMMFVQQKITMPDMAKDNPSMAMMKWMPVFMTVIFLNFPAGLTLYWFVSNCISFTINVFLKRKLAKTF